MPNLYMDVDVDLSEVPINIMPLIDDTDFKSIEASLVYNQAGLALKWNFITTAGAYSQTAVTPTNTGGAHDWVNQGGGYYTIEIPATSGTINNDTEGFGWFSGVATGVLPWRGPIIGFRKASMNNVMIDNGTLQDNLEDMFDGTGYVGGTIILQSDVVKVHGSSLSETSGGYLAAGIVKQYDVAKPVFTSESLNQTADVKTVTDIISASKIAASMDAMSDIDFSAKMKTTLGALTPTSVGKVTGNVDGSVNSVTKTVDANIVSKADIDFSAKEKTSLNASTPASVQGAVKSVTDAVTILSNADITSMLADTNELQSLITSSKLPAQVKGMDSGVLTASSLNADAVNEITAAIWAKVIDGTITFGDGIKLLLAKLPAKQCDVVGNVYTYKDQSGSTILTVTIGATQATGSV